MGETKILFLNSSSLIFIGENKVLIVFLSKFKAHRVLIQVLRFELLSLNFEFYSLRHNYHFVLAAPFEEKLASRSQISSSSFSASEVGTV